MKKGYVHRVRMSSVQKGRNEMSKRPTHSSRTVFFQMRYQRKLASLETSESGPVLHSGDQETTLAVVKR